MSYGLTFITLSKTATRHIITGDGSLLCRRLYDRLFGDTWYQSLDQALRDADNDGFGLCQRCKNVAIWFEAVGCTAK